MRKKPEYMRAIGYLPHSPEDTFSLRSHIKCKLIGVPGSLAQLSLKPKAKRS